MEWFSNFSSVLATLCKELLKPQGTLNFTQNVPEGNKYLLNSEVCCKLFIRSEDCLMIFCLTIAYSIQYCVSSPSLHRADSIRLNNYGRK